MLTSKKLILFAFLFPYFLQALTVNKINGGANIIYVDFSIPTSTVPLELIRTYNSLTATSENTGWSGAFGWGWSSPFESTLNVTPEKNVILRDAGTSNNIFFKPEKEDPKIKEAFFENVKRAYFEQKKNRKILDTELVKLQLPAKISVKLKSDPLFRAEMASKYGVPGVIPKGETLVSTDYGYQTIYFKNNQWVREKEGITQIFDNEGRLIRQIDKNGFYFEFKYSSLQKTQLTEIVDQDRSVSLKFVWKQDKVIELVDNRGVRAKYVYDTSGNLISVTDSNNQVYSFKYENKKYSHLLTKIDYLSENSTADKIFRELRYDDNGVVTYHRDKDGTETSYSFGRSAQDPENNFWTKTTKKSKGLSEEQYDEFTIKNRADGSKYLYKQDTKIGNNTTTSILTPCCGKPSQIIKNGEITSFKYNDFGLLIEKNSPKEIIKVDYDTRWKKVSRVEQNGLTSNYQYDKNGNLIKASNSKKEQVSLKYDKLGRITEMVDTDGKMISFKYGNQGKPTQIAEKGVGTIRIEYDSDGRITKTDTLQSKEKGRRPSEMKSQEIIQRLMKGFQRLLDIIRPASVTLNT